MRKNQHNPNNVKQDFRADDSILSSALRPGLVLDSKLSLGIISSKLTIIVITLCLIVLSSVFIGFFSKQNVSASSVTLTIPSSALSLDIKPNSGTVFQKSTPATISVATDSSYGYSLSIHSKNEDSDSSKSNDLLNGSSKISSIISSLNESDFQNSGENNTWGYLPSKLNSSINSDFQPGPTSEPTTLDITESSSEGTDYDITLATKIGNTLPAGTYNNTFVLTVTSNDPTYDNIMQNWSGCTILNTEDSIQLTDIRDGNTYTVTKLLDNKCWMTTNLKIGKTDAETKLTSKDSDIINDFTLPSSSDNFDLYNNDPRIHINNKYGTYYNYAAATGGFSPSSSYFSTQSICPKGWRLPFRDDFLRLSKANGGTTGYREATLLNAFRNAPNNFLIGGYYYGNSVVNEYEQAYYWSNASDNNLGAYGLFLYSSIGLGYASAIEGTSRTNGAFVRCVSRSNDSPIMQSVSEWKSSLREEQNIKVMDFRDGKEYAIARLKDGNIWMTQNLAIGINIATVSLGQEDTDLPDSISRYDIQMQKNGGGFNKDSVEDSYVGHEDRNNNQPSGYYSWFVATAGTGRSTSDDKNADGSICPKNWRLPTDEEYANMFANYNNSASTLRKEPTNFVLSGYYYDSKFSGGGSQGVWWTSRRSTLSRASSKTIKSTGISSAAQSWYHGFSVRCIVREDE